MIFSNERLSLITYDDITKRKKNAANNELFANMNSHHQNIKLIVETKPTRFLNRVFNINYS